MMKIPKIGVSDGERKKARVRKVFQFVPNTYRIHDSMESSFANWFIPNPGMYLSFGHTVGRKGDRATTNL